MSCHKFLSNLCRDEADPTAAKQHMELRIEIWRLAWNGSNLKQLNQLKLNQIQESRPCPDWSGRKRPNPKIPSRRVCQQDQEGKNFHCKSVAGEKGSKRIGEKPAATDTTSTIDTIVPPSIKRMGSNRGLLAFRLACIFQLTSETEFLHILCHAEMSSKEFCQNGPYPGSLPGLTMPLSLTKQLMQMLWVKLPQLITELLLTFTLGSAFFSGRRCSILHLQSSNSASESGNCVLSFIFGVVSPLEYVKPQDSGHPLPHPHHPQLRVPQNHRNRHLCLGETMLRRSQLKKFSVSINDVAVLSHYSFFYVAH